MLYITDGCRGLEIEAPTTQGQWRRAIYVGAGALLL